MEIFTLEEVYGYRCRTKAEYEAALRDEKKIERIKAGMDENDFKSVEKVYRNLINHKYDFETPVGTEIFDDYIYELYNKNKSGSKVRKSKSVESKNVSRSERAGKKDAGKKANEDDDLYDDPEFEKLVQKEIKKNNSKRRIALWALFTLAFLSIIYFGLYSYYSNKSDKIQQQAINAKKEADTAKALAQYVPTEVEAANDEDFVYVEPTVLEKYEDLYNSNKSLIGWIEIADTNIDYPVMQTVNNEYYLNHNFNQEQDRNGCIFLDCNCNIYPRSTNLIIYGHHMKSGKMFGTLNKLEDESFYKDHPYIYFDTIYEEGVYQICYVFRDRVRTNDDVGFKYYEFYNAYTKEEFDSYMQEMKDASLYDTGVDANYGDVLITLSTCDYVQNNGRFVVVAKRIEL